MNLPEDIDLLLVGHGLAGALLADALERRGKRVAVADPYLPFGATKVAAGILNPIIGPKLNAPWRIKDCLNKARETYDRLGKAWKVELYREFRMIRIFKDEEMSDRWQARKEEAATAPFMGKTFGPEELCKMGVESPFGAGEAIGAAALRARELIEASRRHLSDGGLFYSEAFDPQDAPSGPRIVFCEGFRVGAHGFCLKDRAKHWQVRPLIGTTWKAGRPMKEQKGFWKDSPTSMPPSPR
jgi:glycine/D-amino acid oxidase-like deaminating enzyme